MFAAISFSKPSHGSYELTRYEYDNYGYYSLVLKNKIRSGAASSLLIRLSRMTHIAVSDNFKNLPEVAGITRFNPHRFDTVIYRNIILKLLSDISLPVGVFDAHGFTADILAPVIIKSGICTVYTQNPDAFYSVNESCAKTAGVRAVITQNPSALYGCPLIFAPFGTDNDVFISSFSVIIGRDGYRFNPADIPRIRDSGYNDCGLSSYMFCAALYTLCGESKAGLVCPQKVQCGGITVPLDDVVQMLNRNNH